jgi:hypothetical protein
MKINEIINEAGLGIDMHLAPKLLQQELDQLVELIKKGGYVMTPEDLYVFQQAKENSVFHPDEIDFNNHNKKLGAELKPELLKFLKVIRKSGDISHLVDYDLGNKHKELLKQQVRTPAEVNSIYGYVRLSLLKNACNGTWSDKVCYLDNHKWILDREKEKKKARSLAWREEMRQDPEWVKKEKAKHHAYYEKMSQDPEFVEKKKAQTRAYQEKMRQDPEWIEMVNARSLAWREEMRQDPEWVKKSNAQGRAYSEKYRQDPEWVKKKKARSLAWQEKMRQDPEYVEKVNARNRAYYKKNKST